MMVLKFLIFCWKLLKIIALVRRIRYICKCCSNSLFNAKELRRNRKITKIIKRNRSKNRNRNKKIKTQKKNRKKNKKVKY
jgi:hypothetical protein